MGTAVATALRAIGWVARIGIGHPEADLTSLKASASDAAKLYTDFLSRLREVRHVQQYSYPRGL